jgi:hypothetical protein
MKLWRPSERAQSGGRTVVIVAEPGVGKTFQARYLGADALFVDLEGGTLALEGEVKGEGGVLPPFQGRVISGIGGWEEASALMALLTGPDPYRQDGETFSRRQYEQARERYPDMAKAIAEAPVLFLDSLSWLARIVYEWAKAQPSTWVTKGGRQVQDQWAVYRLLADEMVRFVRLAQVAAARDGKTLVMSCLLERDREIGWTLTMPGQRTAEEVRGVCDVIVALMELVVGADGTVQLARPGLDGKRTRGFVCSRDNPWSLPVKDRSSRLSVIEPPRLDLLLAKLGGAK